MQVGSKEEIKMFTNFMMDHRPTVKNFHELAKLYNVKSNGKTIFPKLPSMVKAYYKRWDQNQKIKAAAKEVGGNVKSLLGMLWKFSTNMSDVHDEETVGMALSETVQKINQEINDDGLIDESNGINSEVIDFNPSISQIIESERSNPPIQAPTQCHYITTGNGSRKHVEAISRRCAWYPDCQSSVTECNSCRKDLCMNYEKLMNAVDPELNIARKRQMKNKCQSIAIHTQRPDCT